MVFFFGFATGIGLSLTVLSAMFFHGAAKLDQAVESALMWQEVESKSLIRQIDAPQNESGSERVDATASVAASR